MKKFFMNIFISLLTVTLIPVIIANFYFYKISEKTIKEHINNLLSAKLDFAQSNLSSQLLSAEKNLDQLIKLYNFHISNYKEILKKIFYSHKIFSEILLLNKNFKIVDGISRFNSIALHKPLNINRDFKYKLQYTTSDVNLIIMKKVRFENYEFNNINYIYAVLSLRNLIYKFVYNPLGNLQYFILDKKGKLLFHSDYSYVVAGMDYSQALLISKKKDFFKYKLYNPITGKKDLLLMKIKYVPGGMPLFYGVSIPTKVAFAQLTKIKENIIFEAFILIVLMAFISMFLANKIVIPIRMLQKASQNITNGNFDIDLKNLPNNEIGILGENIEKMAQTIKKDITTISNERDKLNRLFNSINNGIYVVDLEYNITMINDKELEYVKIPREKALNNKCYKIFAKRNKPCENCKIGIDDSITLSNIDINNMGFRRNCSRKYVNMTFIKFSSSEYLIYLHDITEIIENVQIINQEKEKFKITLESIGDAVIVTDNNCNITLINKVASNLTEFSEKEAIGKNIQEVFRVIDERDSREIESPVELVIKYKKVINLSNHAILVTKNNKKINIEDSAAPIFNSEGELEGIVLVFRDVTEKKKIEKEIQKVEKLETIGQLAAGIAHDFNNILTGVYGNISLAKLFLTNKEKLEKTLDKAEQSIERAKGLTSQLLTFAKGGAPVKEISSIESIIKESVEFALIGSNIKVTYNFSENIYRVNVDSVQISQVFNNLTLNAKDAMKEGGEIIITIENVELSEKYSQILPAGKYVKIIFKDSGSGIDKDILPNIFNPFFTTKEKGSGLGLSTSYSIIQKHDGHIEVFSEKGRGTTFTIYLPAVEKDEGKEEIEEKNKDKTFSKELNILIMDDSEEILESAKELFNYLGCHVDTAVNGEEAIEKYKNIINIGKQYDLVIMDLTVKGGMGGKETIEKLLNIDEKVVAIVSSGYSDDPVMANFSDYGFKYALSKPYTLNEIKKMIETIKSYL